MLWRKYWPRRLTLARERIYILPTKAGFTFLGFTIALLLMGAIYASQLVNLMAFLLLTLFALSMVMTHQNLQGLSELRVRRPEAFAQEDGALEFSFQNRDGAVKEGLVLDLLPRKSRRPWGGGGIQFRIDDAATERHDVHTLLKFRPENRGRVKVERVRLSTRAPLGLFHAWRTEDLSFDLWVYPERRAVATPQTPERGDQGEASARTDRAEIWGDSHPAEFGGSLRRLDWTRTARTDQPWVRPWNAEDGARKFLDWDKFEDLEIERRLSHFTFEVDQSLLRGDELEVRGPWGTRSVDRESARELWRLFAEWPR